MAVELTPKGTRGAQIPPWSWRIMAGFNIVFFRLLGRRVRVMGRPLLLLTTVGAKTGQRRQATLGWFPDRQDSWLVVGSRGGSSSHAAWCVNLARNPDQVWVEVDGRTVKVRPESLHGEEREQAWQRVVELAPGYGGYQTRTDREIPLVRLTALD